MYILIQYKMLLDHSIQFHHIDSKQYCNLNIIYMIDTHDYEFYKSQRFLSYQKLNSKLLLMVLNLVYIVNTKDYCIDMLMVHNSPFHLYTEHHHIAHIEPHMEL